ncbi:MAG: 4Fe-4S dicluster domain-containing protein [Clostridiales bacterium]|nr:4Fe-4S dicluster domain-containing protein [Clostridiales bacterium]
MNITQDEIRKFLFEKGVSDVGFTKVSDEDFGDCRYAISIVVRLSESIIEEIYDKPTHTYFNHYRTVNAFIDRCLLELGLFIQSRGGRYITVAASQSINDEGWNYRARYSHKKIACMAGLGTIGKSSLFLHKDYGANIRLGTLFTDVPLSESVNLAPSVCENCDICVRACPSGAIKGVKWEPGVKREDMFDPEKCSEYMKKEFKNIGRGAVCGICIKVCPYNK